MTECPDQCRLLFGPYTPPAVRKGDRAFCLFRDADVIITSWSAGRLSWPRCQRPRQRGGSGLLVTDELRRAIENESSAALVYWFGVNQGTVWRWRLAFGIGRWDTPGSQRLHRASSERGANVTRGRPLPSEVREKMRQAAASEERRRQFEAMRAKRWPRHNGEDAKGKTMIAPPTPSDSAFDRLHAAGWSIGDIGGTKGWTVYGHRGEQVIDAHGRTQTEAWAAALVQAEAMPVVIVEG